MPILAQASIYHEEKTLNASDLRRWEENSNKEVNWGSMQQVELLNAQNRLKVMTALLFVYNQQLSLIQKSALAHLCRIASQLVTQGFVKPGHAHRASYGSDPSNAIVPKPLPRIPMSSPFLLELLHAVYFAMFNEFGSLAIQTVDDIHHRGSYELFPEVILVTNAVKNSLHANPSGIDNFHSSFECSFILNDIIYYYNRSTERRPNGDQCGADPFNYNCDRIQVDDHKCIVSNEKATW